MINCYPVKAKFTDAHILNTGPRKLIYVQDNTDERSHTQRISGKAVIISSSECVFVALVLQHAKRVCHIILSPVDSVFLVLYPPPKFSQKQHHFWKITFGHKMCPFFLFSTTFVWNTSH